MQGLIPLTQYITVEKAINAIKLKTCPKYSPGHDRGVWIWGPSRTGKSTWARE